MQMCAFVITMALMIVHIATSYKNSILNIDFTLKQILDLLTKKKKKVKTPVSEQVYQ